MKVYALAVRDARANAIGRVELECTPPGLAIGLTELATYAEGYAPGIAASGTRFVIPYAAITLARVEAEQIHLTFEAQAIPHDRMTLSRFSAGPGVPRHELRQRRLILHIGALATASILALVVLVLTAVNRPGSPFGWSPIASALGYGLLAAGIVVSLGYSLDQRYFLRDPKEDEVRRAFVGDLSSHLPGLERGEAPRPRSPGQWIEKLAELLPSSITVTAATLAAGLLTILFTGTRLLRREETRERARTSAEAAIAQNDARRQEASVDMPSSNVIATTSPVAPPSDQEPALDDKPAAAGVGSELVPERNCLCDRADSPLWSEPLPRLSALLLDSRVVPRETHARLEVDVAVVNNGDEPISELTLHVVFSERKGTQNERTKERPLYFEGPLGPGQAIKWTTEARGDSFRVLAPDFGKLGQNGEGAAPKEAFRALLDAHNRPVRLHAVRVMSYLGDNAAHAEALKLKDAYRARETPFLRRVLAATGELRVCDIELKTGPGSSVGACVHNASRETKENLGLVAEALDQKFDPAQPLANPPLLENELKWRILGSIPADSGKYVRAPLPPNFQLKPGHALEVMADRYELLE